MCVFIVTKSVAQQQHVACSLLWSSFASLGELVEKSKGEESCINKTTPRLLNGSFRTRTSTLTACVAVGCGAERQQLQLQLQLRLGSPGTLLRYGLISREKRNYPESQSVGSVRLIISPWNCGRAVFPSCRLSEQSVLFFTLRGGTCGRDRRGARNSREERQNCPDQLSFDGGEEKLAVCMAVVLKLYVYRSMHLSAGMPFLSPSSHFRGMNVNGSGATCERSCRAAECSRSGRSAGTRQAVMARGQQGFLRQHRN